MAIANYLCENCDHFGVCKINDKLSVFSEDAKKDLGVTIRIENCREYKEVN